MEPNLEDQLKAAERDKYLSETRKAESEKAKIDLEAEKIKKENNKPWWQTQFSGLLGIGFLGFFITFVIYPMSKIENKELMLQTKIDAEKLHEDEIKFKNDSLRFISYSDSVNSTLTLRAKLIADQKAKIDSSDSIFQRLKRNAIIMYGTPADKKEYFRLQKEFERISTEEDKEEIQRQKRDSILFSNTGTLEIKFMDSIGNILNIRYGYIQVFDSTGNPFKNYPLTNSNQFKTTLPAGRYKINIDPITDYKASILDFQIDKKNNTLKNLVFYKKEHK
jgi:hypothetical protein